jgi:hypothetical protein
VAFTTTTGKVISGNKAYLRELKANTPATVTAIQKPSVSQGYAIANLEILKRSLKDVVRGGFIILENHPIGHKITTDPTVLPLTFGHALSLKCPTQGFEVKRPTSATFPDWCGNGFNCDHYCLLALPAKLLSWITPAGFEMFVVEVGVPVTDGVSHPPAVSPADIEKQD